MTTQRLDLRNAEHREELAQAFGWPAVWERLIKRIERYCVKRLDNGHMLGFGAADIEAPSAEE